MSNYNGVALASAARTTQSDSVDLFNPDARGVVVVLDVTAIAATPGLTLLVQGKDPASGKYFTIFSGASVVAVTTNVYTVYPGLTETANVDFSAPLPATWRVRINVADADSATYSVGFSLVT